VKNTKQALLLETAAKEALLSKEKERDNHLNNMEGQTSRWQHEHAAAILYKTAAKEELTQLQNSINDLVDYLGSLGDGLEMPLAHLVIKYLTKKVVALPRRGSLPGTIIILVY
jgi:hypothetical protein